MNRDRGEMKACRSRDPRRRIRVAVYGPGSIFNSAGPRCQKHSRSMARGTRACFAPGGEISSTSCASRECHIGRLGQNHSNFSLLLRPPYPCAPRKMHNLFTLRKLLIIIIPCLGVDQNPWCLVCLQASLWRESGHAYSSWEAESTRQVLVRFGGRHGRVYSYPADKVRARTRVRQTEVGEGEEERRHRTVTNF